MFTGIVQELGTVASKEETDSGIYLNVSVKDVFLENLEIGASIAVNGVCLTVVEFGSDFVSFDIIPETLRVTNLGDICPGSEVNMERSLKFGDEVGGHILSGHVSCRAPAKIIKDNRETELLMNCPNEWIDYIFLKGYVAINGASLTVAKKEGSNFSVFLIPETLNATNLSNVIDGDLLNIEVDQTTYAAVKAAESRLAES